MAVKFDSLNAGDTIYDLITIKMGNTTMRSKSVVSVQVLEIDKENRKVHIKWGNNPSRWVGESQLKRYRRKKPELATSVTGRQTLKSKT